MTNTLIISFVVAITLFAPSFSPCFSLTASDSLVSTKNNSYGTNNLTDRDSYTAWCSKIKQKPTIITVTGLKKDQNKMMIINGYTKNYNSYYNNARARSISIASNNYINNTVIIDSPIFQILDIVQGGSLNLTITDYFKGEKYDDLCISEISFDSSLISSIEHLLPIINSDDTLTDSDVKNSIGDFYKIHKHRLPLLLGLMSLDEKGKILRFLLNLQYYCHKYQESINAELLEIINDQIQVYFRNNSGVLINVLRDNKQIGRRAIIEAFYNYSQNYDVKNRQLTEAVNFYDKSLPFEPWSER